MRTHLLPIYITVTAVGLSESVQPCTHRSTPGVTLKTKRTSPDSVERVSPGVRIRGGSVQTRSSWISDNSSH